MLRYLSAQVIQMESGSYLLDARVVVQFRHEALQGRHKVGLLSRPPTPEGANSTPLSCSGYVAQAVEFGSASAAGGMVRSANRVSFGTIADGASDVRHAAIYNEHDQIVAYGLLQRAPGHVTAGEVAFEPEAIRVRR